MGNTRSQQQQQQQQQASGASRSLCLLYLIRRSWRMVGGDGDDGGGLAARGEKGSDDTGDDDCSATDLSISSRCSGCKGCAYHRQLNFDSSDSEMAPNAEEDLLVTTMPRGVGSNLHAAKERLRPPTYNAEDYAIALRRWGRRALSGNSNTQSPSDNNQGTLPSTCTSSSSSGYASAGNAGEMTLRQFTSVSELLNKLRADLRLAFPSFVQEFASSPADGISLLLETLRGVQLSQSQPAGNTNQGPRRPRARRAALDELGCVECLVACVERCPDAARSLTQAQPGLLALAVCLTSSLNRTRVLALQLLTKVCQTQGGHAAASEAVSTLRLRFGEGGRFRFLAGALLAAKAALPLRLAGVSFLNAFLSSAPRTQTKLYIQAEACEAGLEPRILQEWLKYIDQEDPLSELLRDEVRKWSKNCVDVEALQNRTRRAEETCRVLSKKVSVLQQQLQKLQLERLNEYNSRQQQAAACAVEHSRNDSHSNEKKVSSSAEDEGISFSERSSSPEEHHNRPQNNTSNNNNSIDNDQETTIDDVIEELRIIVKDAEEEMHDWNQLQQSTPKIHKSEFGKSAVVALPASKKPVQTSKARECLRSTEEIARLDRDLKSSASLKIVVPGPTTHEDEDRESAIVPAIIHPQPPRRAPPSLIGNPLFIQQEINRCIINDSEQDEDLLLLLDDDGSDSLLSASRLNYHQQVTPKVQEPMLRQRSNSDFKIESLTDFEISETILDEHIPRKENENRNTNSLGSKQYSKCTNTVQKRTERRKYLRRCQSQDHLEIKHQQEQQEIRVSRSGGVVEHIRKFESLNSFDDRRSLPSIDDSRLRRSESFHQTRCNSSSSRGGGSDNGLAYNVNDHESNYRQSMTKSLDRIDEGLDAMVNVVLAKERDQLCRRLSNDDHRRQRAYHVEEMPIDDRKYTSFLETRPTRHQQQQQQQQRDHSRIFASGRPHDVLGIGKNRFNAGKYSGNNPSPAQMQQFVAKNQQRHMSPARHVRGKVTDMISGLY